MEYIIAGSIFLVSILIIYKNVKTSSKGKCNCGTCSKSCPMNKEKK